MLLLLTACPEPPKKPPPRPFDTLPRMTADECSLFDALEADPCWRRLAAICTHGAKLPATAMIDVSDDALAFNRVGRCSGAREVVVMTPDGDSRFGSWVLNTHLVATRPAVEYSYWVSLTGNPAIMPGWIQLCGVCFGSLTHGDRWALLPPDAGGWDGSP